MKLHITFIIALIFITLLSCGDKNVKSIPLFKIVVKGPTNKIKYNDNIKISLKNNKKKAIDSVIYSIDGQTLELSDNLLNINPTKLGNKQLKATVYFENSFEVISKKITVLSNIAPKIYGYTIINQFPHDNNAYTQGLEFYNDTLYESTGRNGKSSLRKVNYTTGEVIQQLDLSSSYFGEGISILNNKIYMLTWKSKTGFVYDPTTFKQLDTFIYDKSKEGWGLCNDGEKIFKSDGTQKIWTLDSTTLAEQDYIEMVTNTSVYSKANELEYVAGKIYANTYQRNSIMIINPKTGAIEAVVSLAGLKKEVTQHADLDVLNGIAYHPERNTFFVTGKNWDKMFEVTFQKK